MTRGGLLLLGVLTAGIFLTLGLFLTAGKLVTSTVRAGELCAYDNTTRALLREFINTGETLFLVQARTDGERVRIREQSNNLRRRVYPVKCD